MRFSSKTGVIPSGGGACAPAGVGETRTVSALGTSSDRGDRATALPRSTRGACGLLAAAALALVAGCNPEVRGNGVYLEQQRDTGDFQGLDIKDGVAAYITAGQALSVKVIGDANVVPNIATEVFSDPEQVGTGTIRVLHIVPSIAFDPTIPPAVIITVPALSYVRAEGASPVQVKRAAADLFTVRAMGSAQVTLVGAAGRSGDLLDAVLSKQTLLDATQYPTAGAYVELYDKATAKLHSNGPVTGFASGDSRLDNLLGTGDCTSVKVEGTATRICNGTPTP